MLIILFIDIIFLLFKFREEAQKAYEEERRKQQDKKEYQREKMRENIRQKYGIEKPKDGKGKSSKKADQAALEVNYSTFFFYYFF